MSSGEKEFSGGGGQIVFSGSYLQEDGVEKGGGRAHPLAGSINITLKFRLVMRISR